MGGATGTRARGGGASQLREGLGEGPIYPSHACALCSTPKLRGEVARIRALLSGLLATRVGRPRPRPTRTRGSDSSNGQKSGAPGGGGAASPVILLPRRTLFSSEDTAAGQGLIPLCVCCSAGLDITPSRDQVPWRDGFLPSHRPSSLSLLYLYISIFIFTETRISRIFPTCHITYSA